MENIDKKLNKLKDEIHSMHLVSESDDTDFIKLVKLKDISDDLYETLILLHSNYKANMQTVKYNQVLTLIKVIDNNLEMLQQLKLVASKQNADSNTNKQFEPSKIVNNIIKALGAVLVFGISIWGLYHLDKDAGNFMLDLFKLIIDKI